MASKMRTFSRLDPETHGEISTLANVCVTVGLWPEGKGHTGWIKWETSGTANIAEFVIVDNAFQITSWKSRPTGSDPLRNKPVTEPLPELEVVYFRKLVNATIADERAPEIVH